MGNNLSRLVISGALLSGIERETLEELGVEVEILDEREPDVIEIYPSLHRALDYWDSPLYYPETGLSEVKPFKHEKAHISGFQRPRKGKRK